MKCLRESVWHGVHYNISRWEISSHSYSYYQINRPLRNKSCIADSSRTRRESPMFTARIKARKRELRRQSPPSPLRDVNFP